MIGKILKRMRAQKKLKQRELSKIINIPQNTISQYETETIQPTFEIIEKIASACGYQILKEWILNNLIFSFERSLNITYLHFYSNSCGLLE